jgi:hypothetical protein
MSSKTLNQLKRERDALLDEMRSLQRLLHGSFVERFSTCSRPGCKCHAGDRHGPRHYLVLYADGKQRQKYIPNALVETVKEGLEEDERLQQIVARLTELNFKILKMEHKDAKE